ncbi:Fasciclin domain protein [Mariniflexile rhizosphaerae]|uniref:fasciclin domain-containing protein n=1 Tax=unclassified Mariniflexile TaxID=2643887 RepID=UPI000CBD0F6F|nr:fasciclin domain-containing protein [Mariniflexile sp. TRM1-10]AXP81445.1 Fasciclin domain protein [Mariniflexile sp. TRM1-10]PLB18343.1 MAG: Secreted/surface protein with fasciclin-like repeat containing protein [Flavobacteriaceae bacterium FS1-H7996/R]
MKKIIRYYLLFSPLIFFLANCSKKEVDEYYARPDDLEPPIYQQLEAAGNFQNLIKLIEVAGYKDILGKAGYWTMMAPNDAAFENYFQEQGIADVSGIDSLTASKIVKYALIYNAFRTERLSDYQSNIGWEEDMAFRRRTAYYDGFQNKVVDGTPMVVVGSNRNNVEGGDPYISGDNNNKYITYFAEEYMNAATLGSYDYNFFFPNSTYTGFNVLSSEVVQADIVAENGIIHEVNKVSLPPLNLDQKLEESPNYSLFYQLLEDNLVNYVFDQEATTTYQNYTRKSDEVYVKVYDPALSFSPNNENFLKATDNDGQSDAYTLIVPENTALQVFVDEVLLKNYSALDKLPKYVFEDFFNAHMVQAAVWPSKVAGYSNALDEDIRIDMDTDVIEAELLSNGFFYGTNKIQESNLFYSVYTSAYLDPAFTLATRLFNDGSGYREIASNIYSNYTLFLPSDEILMNLGFDYDINRSEWVYVSPETGNEVRGSLARARIARVLYNGIVPTPNMELNDLSGSGIIRSGDFDLPGEYIKWDNNQVFAAGNEVLDNRVNILGYEDQRNGRTYYIDNILEFSEEFQGVDLAALAAETGSQYAYFYEFLKSSGLYDEASGAIDGIELGTPYTFVIPSNDAIRQAVMDGVLPGDAVTGEPNFVPANDIAREGISNFVKYHFIATRTASDDGLINGLTETLLKTEFGEKTYVNIVSGPGDLNFVDAGNRIANYIPLESNHLADRTLIHLVDNYLLYTE